MPLEVWTIGHSTRSAQDFLSLLQAWRIEALAMCSSSANPSANSGVATWSA